MLDEVSFRAVQETDPFSVATTYLPPCMKRHREESPLHREMKDYSEESHVLRVRAYLVEYTMDKTVPGCTFCPSLIEWQHLTFVLKRRVTATEEQASVAHKAA